MSSDDMAEKTQELVEITHYPEHPYVQCDEGLVRPSGAGLDFEILASATASGCDGLFRSLARTPERLAEVWAPSARGGDEACPPAAGGQAAASGAGLDFEIAGVRTRKLRRPFPR